jgi:hypothetical protein
MKTIKEILDEAKKDATVEMARLMSSFTGFSGKTRKEVFQEYMAASEYHEILKYKPAPLEEITSSDQGINDFEIKSKTSELELSCAKKQDDNNYQSFKALNQKGSLVRDWKKNNFNY